jgi:Raf kinase inhibitor-like YbhB/YbcL family protein
MPSSEYLGTTPLRPLRLHCPVLAPDGSLPADCACDGDDRSPPIGWEGVPYGTKSLVMIVDDADAPHKYFVHWLAWNIPANWTFLEAGADPEGEAYLQGTNGFGELGWRGPCPPPEHGAHRYVFRLYALDTTLDLPAGADRAALEEAMRGHVLTQGDLVTHYRRRRTHRQPQPPA